MLKVEKLTKKHNKKSILEDLSFEVKRGEIGIFLGSSGAGKSTLLRVLNNLETYDTGKVLLDSVPLDLKDVSKNHLIGMVFQHFNLFEHLSVEENITLPVMKTRKKEKKEARLIAHEFLNRYELLDKAGVLANKISGGQKQRVALARTLALDPEIVCLDEPTSALDPKYTSQVAECVNEIARNNKIVLLTTHDLNFLNHLNGTIFLLKDGVILEKVSTESYFVSPEKYPKLQEFLTGN